MDVIGALGYHGQELTFLDYEQMAYVTGNSICMLSSVGLHREMLWRQEGGICKIAAHLGTSRFALVPLLAGYSVEIINFPDLITLSHLANPTETNITDVSFSREGDRLCGISDILDRQIFVWDIEKKSILFCHNCDRDFTHILYNPVDTTQILLHGKDGYSVAVVSDIIDSYTIKFRDIKLESLTPMETDGDDEMNDDEIFEAIPNEKITFAIWMPVNRIYVGTDFGNMYEFDTETFRTIPVARMIAALSENDKSHKPILPTCAVLTLDHIVVGTANHEVLWFTTQSLTSAEGRTTDVQPVQVALLTGPLNCVTLDPKFEKILLSSTHGELCKIAVQPKEKSKPIGEAEEDLLGLEEGQANADSEVAVVASAEAVCSNQNGGILCSIAISLPIIGTSTAKMTKKSKNMLSLFVTGSHIGKLTFWTLPIGDIEPVSSQPGGIRRSNHKPLKSIYTTDVAAAGVDASTPCTLGILPSSIRDGSCLLGVGTSDGYLEIYKIDVVEYDDEDDEGGEEMPTDGDEIKLFVRRVSRQRIFYSALSIIGRASNWDEDGTVHLAAVGSYEDNRIFLISGDDKDAISPVMHIALPNDMRPTSFSWTGAGLLIATQCQRTYYSSALSLQQPASEAREHILTVLSPEVEWDSPYPNMLGAFMIQKSGFIALVSLDDPVLNCFPIGAFTGADGSGERVSIGVDAHSDIVITWALSPSEQYLATGCADGSVNIFSLSKNGTNGLKFDFICKAKFHTEAVISMAFSVDSSMVMCCGADGSYFICAIDKPQELHYEFESSRHSVRAKKALTTTHAPLSAKPDNRIWVERKKSSMNDLLKTNFTQKSTEMKANITAIVSRLQTLLETNQSRTDLEQLDRSEFVIDTFRRDKMREEADGHVERIRELYRLRKFWNELNAARIRSLCWDRMEINSIRLLPFAYDSAPEVKYVSSFAVPRYTDKQKTELERVRRLRCIEMRSQRFQGLGSTQRLDSGNFRVCWTTVAQSCPSRTAYVCGDGSRWPSAEIVEDQDEAAANKEATEESKDKKDAPTPGEPAGDDDDDGSVTSLDNGSVDIDENNIFNLLYPPQAIRTGVQKRNHIIMLKEVVRIMKVKFNAHFEKLAQEKDDSLASINFRIARIDQIMTDLGVQETLFRPTITNVEIAGSAIVVTDSEIVSRPYETEAAREARLLKEAEALRLEAENESKEALARALDDMMYGTLEVKKNILADASSLVRPQWMIDTDPKDMTEYQLREYEEFEAKYKAMQEEQTKYRKQLEQESKKLRAEVAEITRAFDEKLVALANKKVRIVREIVTHELFIAQLGQNILHAEQAIASINNLDVSIDKTRRERQDLKSKVESMTAHCEETRVKLEAIQLEEREMDRDFIKNLTKMCNNQKFDTSDMNQIKQLYRLRSYPRDEDDDDGGWDTDGVDSETSSTPSGRRSSSRRHRGSNRKSKNSSGRRSNRRSNSSQNQSKKAKMRASRGMSSAGGGSRRVGGGSRQQGGMVLGPMQEAAQALNKEAAPEYFEGDPFYMPIKKYERMKRNAEIPIPEKGAININDTPEGLLDQATLAKLNELRNARLEKEIQGKELSIKLNELKSKLDVIHADETAVHATLRSILGTKEKTIDYSRLLERDLQILIALRQGQDEIDQDAIVTDYNDAILLPISILGKFNARIKELGKEKIGVLSRIKHFRRKINLLDWEAEHLLMECQHLDQYYSDLQLFRVTRGLQRVLREGTNQDEAKARLDRVGKRREFLKADAEAKLGKLNKQKSLILKQIDERGSEMQSLERKIHELRAQVKSRLSVRASRDEARQGTGDAVERAGRRMKRIVQRRQLVDTARAQAQEIDFLRQELDVVRQRTFPSFIRAVKKRVPNPDDREFYSNN